MGIRMLSMKEADWDAFHMSFFIFSTTIFALEIGRLECCHSGQHDAQRSSALLDRTNERVCAKNRTRVTCVDASRSMRHTLVPSS
jgi:hypothetical protein